LFYILPFGGLPLYGSFELLKLDAFY